MKIGFASDHRGLKLKEELIDYFKDSYEIIDYGTNSEESTDYPDYASDAEFIIRIPEPKTENDIIDHNNKVNPIIPYYKTSE